MIGVCVVAGLCRASWAVWLHCTWLPDVEMPCEHGLFAHPEAATGCQVQLTSHSLCVVSGLHGGGSSLSWRLKYDLQQAGEVMRPLMGKTCGALGLVAGWCQLFQPS